MKSWPSNDPKAALMSRKRSAIVNAARQAFLEGGYAKTSMDSIAKAADVGIKTVYRHFENKDDLFSAVMQAACDPVAFEELSGHPIEQVDPPERAWFSKPPRAALVMAGVEYLENLLSDEQLALYRVVTQDAHAFPELGSHYKEQVIDHAQDVFAQYLTRWGSIEKWKIKEKRGAANTFAALLRGGIFEDALHGLRKVSKLEITSQARSAATKMMILLDSHAL